MLHVSKDSNGTFQLFITLEDAFVFKYTTREEKQTLAGSECFKHGIQHPCPTALPAELQEQKRHMNAE